MEETPLNDQLRVMVAPLCKSSHADGHSADIFDCTIVYA